MRTNIISQQGMKKLTAKKAEDNSNPKFHEQSQRFIKNAHKQGKGVKVVDGELRKVGVYKPDKQWKAPNYKNYNWGKGVGK